MDREFERVASGLENAEYGIDMPEVAPSLLKPLFVVTYRGGNLFAFGAECCRNKRISHGQRLAAFKGQP